MFWSANKCILCLLQLLFVVSNSERNPFNDKSFIVYRPQTPVVENNGQEKSGSCPIVKSSATLSQFSQVCRKSFRTKSLTKFSSTKEFGLNVLVQRYPRMI